MFRQHKMWLMLAATGLMLLAVACGGDDDEGGLVIQSGDRVSLHYTGTLDDGEQFDSSVGGSPLEFVVGTQAVIDGFDQAVVGMKTGESKTFRLEPAEAYGEPSDDLVLTVPASAAPEGLSVGDQVAVGDGRPATVISIDEENVVVDANHQLAGQALTFAIEVVEITRDSE